MSDHSQSSLSTATIFIFYVNGINMLFSFNSIVFAFGQYIQGVWCCFFSGLVYPCGVFYQSALHFGLKTFEIRVSKAAFSHSGVRGGLYLGDISETAGSLFQWSKILFKHENWKKNWKNLKIQLPSLVFVTQGWHFQKIVKYKNLTYFKHIILYFMT